MGEKWKRSRETLMVRDDAEWIVSKIRKIIRMMGFDPDSRDERLLKMLTDDIEGRLHDYYEEGYNDGRGDSGRGGDDGE